MDDLQTVAAHIDFVYEIDVLHASVVEREVADVVGLHSSGLFDDRFTRFVEKVHHKSLPLWVGEVYVVETLELFAHIAEQLLWLVEFGEIFIAQGL